MSPLFQPLARLTHHTLREGYSWYFTQRPNNLSADKIHKGFKDDFSSDKDNIKNPTGSLRRGLRGENKNVAYFSVFK